MCIMTYDFAFPVTIFWLRHCEHKRVILGYAFTSLGVFRRGLSVCIAFPFHCIWTILFCSTFIESILLLKRADRQDTEALGCCWIADRLMLYIIDTLYISTSYPLRLCSIVGCKEVCAARPLSKQHHGIQPDGSQRSAKYKHRPRRSPKHQFEIFSCGWESQCVIRAMICKLMRLQ